MRPFPHRLRNLRKWLKESGLDALVVTHLPNIWYLSGFSGSSGILLVTSSGASLFTDGRYRIQAREEVRGARVQIVRGDPILAAGKRLESTKPGRVGFESSRLSVAALRQLKRAAGRGAHWRAVEGGVEQFRVVKDASELEFMRAAARLGSELFREILPHIREGVQELDLAAEMEYRMKKSGASGSSFETIVAFGPRTALPHARPTQRRLGKNELVLLDWGAILRGYCCDLTRTVFLGKAPAKLRNWYRAVLEAQGAARDGLRAGVAAGDVDAAARGVLQREGLARYFTHSTGHGLGLEVHEGPRIARNQSEVIQPGNAVTLEPGVYVEGVGGIRIEDDFVVTLGGNELLTTASREFFQL